MKPWTVALVVIASTYGILLMVLLMLRWYSRFSRVVHDHRPKHQESFCLPPRVYADRPKKCEDVAVNSHGRERSSKVSNSCYSVRHFEWTKHPSQMADALDRGWTAFALSYSCIPPGPSVSPMPWNICTKGSLDEAFLPEIHWGITGPGAELVQLIRLNPRVGLQESFLPSVQTLQSALPLPGPSFEPNSFPQEAYFELTILSNGTGQKRNSFSYEVYVEDDRLILIPDNISSSMIESSAEGENYNCFSVDNFDSDANSDQKTAASKELLEKRGHQVGLPTEDDAKHIQSSGETMKEINTRVIAVGLTAESASSFHLPGTYWGSIGFQSNGKILLNGTSCTQEGSKFYAERRFETTVNTTLGCGYYPPSKKVFFTLNGELMAEVIGTESEFGQPLYVAVGSNFDTTVMVNFGQAPFVYGPANNQRAANPSGWKPFLKFSKSRENSGDFFTMSTVDSRPSDSTTFEETEHSHAFSVTDSSDCFEIVLESVTLQL
ncbi:hypothetical protein O6H91_02G134700 [Diphasiastrum complanatum]|uniref:Uncharacterized protein n=3 Tax=Diphasiastrum complanatum TaxID=34168 RepID=A0ACC2EL85_DIPCM|nr:hypothetical protein O6H91_02G134700 [Diphasiastrum complanatum]KAJ7567170.1 hypothetical protein O6H91_02G134700 [Diphasiastrum complanatum]KAJ7567171.1 hypothetical protein O6H91_02G134700 [Diphasiastrum complanatum]